MILDKLRQYIKSSLGYRQTRWIGDVVIHLNLHFYAGANFGGACTKSTTGVQLNIEGPQTCFPTEASRSVQQAVTTSTPEAEMKAGDATVRKVGPPCMLFWEFLNGFDTHPKSPECKTLLERCA